MQGLWWLALDETDVSSPAAITRKGTWVQMQELLGLWFCEVLRTEKFVTFGFPLITKKQVYQSTEKGKDYKFEEKKCMNKYSNE